MDYTLGIDMGVASIGWAVINEQTKFIRTGSRIFPAGFDAINTGKESNSNDNRRASRGMRRRIRRKANRKLLLRQNLEQLSWVPSSKHERDDAEVHQWERLDPYELRHKALSEQVSLMELGRIILHLNQRRGFLSLRKSADAADKESSGILGEMDSLERDIKDSGQKTLGSYLYTLREKDLQDHKDVPMVKIRGKYLRRVLTYKEFDLIWKTQQKFYPDILTDTVRFGATGQRPNPTAVVTPEKRIEGMTLLQQFGLENLLFFQRRVYWPESSIGLCQLEQSLLFEQLREEGKLKPEFKNERRAREKTIRRAPIADRRFQEFRMLCEVNNLRLTNDEIDATKERLLSQEERQVALDYCKSVAAPSISGLKKKLVKQMGMNSIRSLHLNLEAGGRTKISGLKTDSTLGNAKVLGKYWQSYTESQRNQIVEILANPALVDDDIEEQLTALGCLDDASVGKLMGVDLGSARANLSIIALEKLLPFLRQGMRYVSKEESGDSALHSAGYSRRDEQETEALDVLPRFDDPQYPFAQSITSPVVRRSMTELRKIVNGLMREHGKPARIHVEMSRDLKMSSDKRKELNIKNRKREKERSNAKKFLEENNIIGNRDAVERYLLWEDQSRLCAYSQEPISFAQLFHNVDVDHILPYSRCADNGYNNKVVCFAEMNRAPNKGNRTPYEWLAKSDPTAYDRVVSFAKQHLKAGGKYKKFIMDEIPDGFTNRDLNDTAWMAKAACSYLAQLYPVKESYKVQGTKGRHTATLRNYWKLNGLLRCDGIELKSRDDHRHHALDAVVIALTNKARIDAVVEGMSFRQVEQEAREAGKRIYRLKPAVKETNKLAAPWKDFRADVQESLNSIWVSHRPKKKVSGALHKETYYGKTADGRLVVRKSVASLSSKDLSNIRDEFISELIQLHLKDGGTLEDEISMPSGVPIRTVRVLVDSTHLTIRQGKPHETHVWSGGTHHVAVFAVGDGKCIFEPVNLLEATKRKNRKERIFQSNPPAGNLDAEFLFYLSLGETILCEVGGVKRLFIYKTMNTNSGQMFFANHTDASDGNKDPETGKSTLKSATSNTFLKNFPKAQKVTVLPTGELRRSQ